MSLTEKYTNVFGEEVTDQQKDNLDKYLKAYYNNGVLTKEELFENDELVNTIHQVTNQSEIDSILISESSAGFEMSYMLGLYKFMEVHTYSSGVLVYKRLYVSESNDDTICVRNYKLDPLGLELENHTEKTFHENDEQRFIFEYDGNGDCLLIHDMLYAQNDILAADIGDPSKTDFTWTGFEYYEFANPVNPDDLIIV